MRIATKKYSLIEYGCLDTFGGQKITACNGTMFNLGTCEICAIEIASLKSNQAKVKTSEIVSSEINALEHSQLSFIALKMRNMLSHFCSKFFVRNAPEIVLPFARTVSDLFPSLSDKAPLLFGQTSSRSFRAGVEVCFVWGHVCNIAFYSAPFR